MVSRADDLDARLARIAAVEAVRLAIARFGDAVARNDPDDFANLWTEAGVWEISAPYTRREEGLTRIRLMFQELMVGWKFFGQLAHGSVIEIAADNEHARAHTMMREFARQSDGSRSYDNVAIYDDALVRSGNAWRFERRSYHYLWLSEAPIPGTGFALPEALRGDRLIPAF